MDYYNFQRRLIDFIEGRLAPADEEHFASVLRTNPRFRAEDEALQMADRFLDGDQQPVVPEDLAERTFAAVLHRARNSRRVDPLDDHRAFSTESGLLVADEDDQDDDVTTVEVFLDGAPEVQVPTISAALLSQQIRKRAQLPPSPEQEAREIAEVDLLLAGQPTPDVPPVDAKALVSRLQREVSFVHEEEDDLEYVETLLDEWEVPEAPTFDGADLLASIKAATGTTSDAEFSWKVESTMATAPLTDDDAVELEAVEGLLDQDPEPPVPAFDGAAMLARLRERRGLDDVLETQDLLGGDDFEQEAVESYLDDWEVPEAAEDLAERTFARIQEAALEQKVIPLPQERPVRRALNWAMAPVAAAVAVVAFVSMNAGLNPYDGTAARNIAIPEHAVELIRTLDQSQAASLPVSDLSNLALNVSRGATDLDRGSYRLLQDALSDLADDEKPVPASSQRVQRELSVDL